MTEPEADEGLLTFAFVDLDVGGATAVIDYVDADAPGRQLARVRDHLAAHGGRPVEAGGDGLLVAFSSPRRAVSWAVACQRHLGDGTPRVRIGLDTGEAVEVDGERLGGPAHAAANITARAAGGEVLVADVVRQLVGGALPGVTFTDRGRTRLEGSADRCRLWAADGRAPGPAPEATVGRGPELEAVDDLVASTAAGAGAALLVEGEAGIGKSHLVGNLVERCRPAGLALIEVVADDITRRPGLLPWAVADHSGPRSRPRALLRELLDGDADVPVDRSYAVVETCLATLETLAARAPVMLVVEDAHWADDLSLTILRAAIRQLLPSGVSVVVTFRPTPRPPLLDRLLDPTEDALAGGARRLLRLGPLDAGDVVGLAASMVGAGPGPKLRHLLEATGGNPLFVGELLRSLDDEDLVSVRSGVAEVSTTELPGSLQETIVRRLSWLPPAARELLRLASLLGTSFTLTEVAAVCGRPVIDVAAELREASMAGLLVGDGERLTFRHDLVREAVYGSMLPAERRDLHRAAGHALARVGAPSLAVAQQLARAATQGDLEAVEWLERAATEIVSMSPSTACALYEQAAALAPERWTGLAALQAGLIEPLAWCGRFDRAEEVAATVLATAPDPEIVFAVTRGMAAIDGNRGRIPEAISHLTRASEVDGAPADEAERLRCFRGQLEVLTGALPWTDAVTAAEATLAHGRATGDATTQCVALQVIAVAHAVEGYAERTLSAVDEAVRLLEAGHVRPASYVIPDAFQAGTLLYLDRIDEALVAAERARARHERAGSLTQLPLLHMVSAAASFETGRWDDCLADAEAGQRVSDDTGSHNFVLYFAALNARTALRRGDLAAAEAHLAAGVEYLTAGWLFGADWLFDAQVEVLVAKDEPEAAWGVADLVWAQTGHLRHFYGSRHRGVTTTRLAVATGRLDRAEETARSVEEGANRSPVTTARAAALHCRGLATGAVEPLLEAVDLLRDSPFTPMLASACEDAASLLLDGGAPRRARELLDDAATLLADLRADGDLQRVHELQRRAGARVRRSRTPRPPFGWESLTPTELTVSELVAEGLTNPEIGARLYVSRRTVETHLAHVFRKLSLASRAQLAAEVVRREVEPRDP